MNKSPKSAIIIAAVLLFSAVATAYWYVEAGNFSDKNVAGTYVYSGGNESSTLYLNSDHTFSQKWTDGKAMKEANGTWQLFPSDSQSHIALSLGFVKVAEEELSKDGTAYGQLSNNFGILSITMSPPFRGPRFRKKL